jgi:hypothetical protein
VQPATVLALVAALASAPGADAQSVDTESGEAKVACFRGQPLPRCKSFWIVEMQGSTPLLQTERFTYIDDTRQLRHDTFDSVLEWNLGHMVNVGDRHALGGVITVGTGNTDPLTGIKLRARRWMGRDVSLEVETGLVRSNATDTQFPGVNGGTADVRLNIRDQGTFYVRWDVLDLPQESYLSYYDPGGTHHGFSVGVGLGSVPALAGTGGLALLYAVLLGLYLSDAS